MMYNESPKVILIAILAVLLIGSCAEDNAILDKIDNGIPLVSGSDNETVLGWYDTYLEVERYLPDFRPNTTARALAYIGLAAYESVLPGMPDHSTMASHLEGLETVEFSPNDELFLSINVDNPIYWEAVLNRVYFRTLSHFMINRTNNQNKLIIDTYFDNLKRLNSVLDSEVMQHAINRANEVSDAVIVYAQSDVESVDQIWDITPSDYSPPSGAGYWQPTGPDFSLACHPYWYKVRKFMVQDNDYIFIDPSPYSEDSQSIIYKEATEVNETVDNITEEERWIAEFWSDDIVNLTFSPAARQIAIANQLVTESAISMEEALEMYLRLGISLNDAAVVCWEGKYKYNLERPVDYIKRMINPEFTTMLAHMYDGYVHNPNFPAYPSGHSTFASTVAPVFDHFFSNRMSQFTDRSHDGRTEFFSEPRTFTSFDEMAEENAMSRIPLGVHFRQDCVEGLRLGYIVGDKAIGFSLEK